MRPVPHAFKAALLALGICLVVTTGGAAPPSASALSKIKCKETTGAEAIDPIVHHNQPGADVHVHQFFGNNSWLDKGNGADYDDLLGSGTNCDNRRDTAGYWVPQLRTLSGKPIEVQSFAAYYRPFSGVGGPAFGPGEVFPADTRLVSSDYNWSCGELSGAKADAQPSIPSCAGQSGLPGHTLTARVTFPNCWDGTLPNHHDSDVGDTSDNKHWAYKVRAGTPHDWKCPRGFDHEMIELRETIQYDYTGDGTDLRLSSDAEDGTNDGRSLHADFWNTWDMSGLQSMVRNCVHEGGNYTSAECG